MIQVLIADDHPLIRAGLRHVLSLEPDFAPPGEAVDALELLAKLPQGRWDAIILDISMPGRSGLEILADIWKLRPAIPVLILSIHSEDQYAVRAMKAGASGYLTKSSASGELVNALRKVVSGRKYVSSWLAEVLANAVESGADRLPHETLSDREYEVLRRIAAGKSVSLIAVELSLSIKTVSTYRSRTLEKMRMRTNADLTRYAIRAGLVE